MPYLESVIAGVISLPSSQDVLVWTLFLVFKETSQGKLPRLISCVLVSIWAWFSTSVGHRVEVAYCFGQGAPFLLCLPLRFNEDTL